MPKGNYAALKELTPITTDLGKIVRDQQTIDARQRAEDLAKEQMQKEEDRYNAEQTDKAREKLAVDLSNMKEVVMNSPSGDHSLAYGINAAMEEKIRIFDELQKNKGVNNAYTMHLQLKNANLDKYSSNLATATKKYRDYGIDFAKGIAEGKYSTTRNKNLMANMEDIFVKSNFVTGFDDNGMPTVIKYNSETKKMEQINYQDFFNGSQLKPPVQAFDIPAFQAEMKNSLGTEKAIKQAAGSYTKTTDVNVKKDALISLANKVKGIIGADEANPTEEAKAIWEENMGGKPENFDYKKVDEYVTKLGLSAVDEEHSSIYDTAAANAAYRASQSSKDEKTKGIKDIEVMRDSDGQVAQFPVHYAMSEKPGVGTKFTLPKPIDFGIGDNVISLDSYTLTDRNTIQYSGLKKIQVPSTRMGGKPTDSWEYVDGGDLNETETNRFARALDLKDNYELIKKSKEKMGVEPQTSSTNTMTTQQSTNETLAW